MHTGPWDKTAQISGMMQTMSGASAQEPAAWALPTVTEYAHPLAPNEVSNQTRDFNVDQNLLATAQHAPIA